MTAGTRDGSVKVLSKAVAVLRALADAGDATPAELAQRLGEPRSSLYRLLAALEEHGLVEPGPRRSSHQLGLELYALGQAVANRFADLRTTARPILERLNAETGQTVFLTVRRGFEALCIDRLDGEWVQLMILPLGGAIALHGGANARALLAFESETFWQAYLDAGPLMVFTTRTTADADALFAELRRTRDRGYSLSDEDVIPGIASVGAPIRDRTDSVCASISLSGPRPSILGDRADDSIAAVRAAGNAIAQRLGSPSATPLPPCAAP